MAAQLLYHFTPSEKITPLTLTPVYTPWQPNFYLILPPLDKLPPHSYTILPPIAAHSYMAISVRGGGNSLKLLPLQPIAAHCSPLLHDNFSHGV